MIALGAWLAAAALLGGVLVAGCFDRERSCPGYGNVATAEGVPEVCLDDVNDRIVIWKADIAWDDAAIEVNRSDVRIALNADVSANTGRPLPANASWDLQGLSTAKVEPNDFLDLCVVAQAEKEVRIVFYFPEEFFRFHIPIRPCSS